MPSRLPPPSRGKDLHGVLDALALTTLTFGPRHGYAIVRWLKDQSKDALQVEEGSLYPALYRMERDGWIESDWGMSELGRKAKFYSITEKGRKQLRAAAREFTEFVNVVMPLLQHPAASR